MGKTTHASLGGESAQAAGNERAERAGHLPLCRAGMGLVCPPTGFFLPAGFCTTVRDRVLKEGTAWKLVFTAM